MLRRTSQSLSAKVLTWNDTQFTSFRHFKQNWAAYLLQSFAKFYSSNDTFKNIFGCCLLNFTLWKWIQWLMQNSFIYLSQSNYCCQDFIYRKMQRLQENGGMQQILSINYKNLFVSRMRFLLWKLWEWRNFRHEEFIGTRRTAHKNQ